MGSSHGGASALVALCFLAELALRGAGAAGEPLVPAIFVFGDSTVDVGNNNFLPDCSADCRANYPLYGVDYPSGEPTGRFSNGYNLADHLARFLGFAESPPAYGSLPLEGIIGQMMSGINFASGGSGLQDLTVWSSAQHERPARQVHVGGADDGERLVRPRLPVPRLHQRRQQRPVRVRRRQRHLGPYPQRHRLPAGPRRLLQELPAGAVCSRGEEVQHGEPVAGGVLPDAEVPRVDEERPGRVRLLRHGQQPLQAAVPHGALDAPGPERRSGRHELLHLRLGRLGRFGLQPHRLTHGGAGHGVLRRLGAVRVGQVRQVGHAVPQPRRLPLLGRLPPDGDRVGGAGAGDLRRPRDVRPPHQHLDAGGALVAVRSWWRTADDLAACACACFVVVVLVLINK